MMPTNLINRFDRDKINILFNGNFYHKGGDVAINAFEILNQQYNNIQMTIVSNPPEHLISYYKKKYSNIFFYKKGPNITRPDLINQFYMNADIFLYPSQGDTYANPLLLAMNSALPIITTDYYAFPEFVENKKNGYMIKSNLWEIEKTIPAGNIPYIESEKIIRKNNKQNIIEIVNYTEELIDNAQQRRSMGRIGREILESGKLSIKVRDSKLLSIFKNSIE
jgi:glycosyltransferase involved in cell wall biosynthesis